jgi:hypothetical protein
VQILAGVWNIRPSDYFTVTLNIGMIACLLLATVIPMCSKFCTVQASCKGRGNASLLISLPWWWWWWGGLTPFAIYNHRKEPPASLKWKGGSGHGETFSSPLVGASPVGLFVHILSFHRLRCHGLYLFLYHYTTDDPRVSPSRMQKCDQDGIISAGCQLDWTPYSEYVLYSLYF